MLNHRLYESLPYLYLGSGLVLFTLFSSVPATIAPAALLYIAGSIVWILRSNARRKDRRQNNILQAHIRRDISWHYQPVWLYEELPFLYIATGMACLYSLEPFMGAIGGILFILAGITALGFRYFRRNNAPV